MGVEFATVMKSDHARRLVLAQGLIALFDTSKCTIENMNRSCFAAEHCQSFGSVMPQIDILLRGPTLVAYEDDIFLGCVGLEDKGRDVFLHSFCVRSDRRGGSIGTVLIERALELYPHAVYYLHVIRPCETTQNDDASETIRDRLPRLLKLYQRFGFEVVQTLTDRLVLEREKI